MKEFYDSRIHQKYFPTAARKAAPPRYRRIVQAVEASQARSPKTLLEVGVEDPISSLFLIRGLGLEANNYECVDISASSVTALSKFGLRCTCCDVSSDILPFPSGRFDIVVMSEVLEHLIDPDHALVELKRVLTPNGLLVTTTPNLASWINRILLLGGFQPLNTETGTSWVFGWEGLRPRSRPVGHLRLWTLRALTEMLRYHGLDPILVGGLTSDPPLLGGSNLLTATDRLFGRIPSLAAGLVVVSRVANSGRQSGLQ